MLIVDAAMAQDAERSGVMYLRGCAVYGAPKNVPYPHCLQVGGVSEDLYLAAATMQGMAVVRCHSLEYVSDM